MTSLLDRLLHLSGPIVYILVGLLVFTEDALFVGFVIPGETAAVLGGVIVSRGSASLPAMLAVVVGTAIVGDTVGYQLGRQLGTRLLNIGLLDKRRAKLDDAQAFLRRRGGSAVFLGRFVAFFRAVMPALAGTSRMSYPRFLAFNAAGGVVWGIGFVLIGYIAGDSYKRVESLVGRGLALVVLLVVVLALVVWRVRKRRRSKSGDPDPHSD
jgi:membrane-associated protein